MLHFLYRKSRQLSYTFGLLLTVLSFLTTPLLANDGGRSEVRRLSRDTTKEEWKSLEQYNNTITRKAFEERLYSHWNPGKGIAQYLSITNKEVRIYLYKNHRGHLATVRFAKDERHRYKNPTPFRAPQEFAKKHTDKKKPLKGLKIAIDPADIGGKWAKMEDRSVLFKGHGWINEGELNVIVGRHIKARLEVLGAKVLLVRYKNEPVLKTTPQVVENEARRLMKVSPKNIPTCMIPLVRQIKRGVKWRIQREANQLYTKTLETRAREALIKRTFQPDITIVLQHNATAESSKGKLTKTKNLNIFFVSGMYSNAGLAYSTRRFHLLRKLFENVTPVEAEVAESISNVFKRQTGYPPVMYGNSSSTKMVIPGNHYIVARNLMFTREHDGPTVITEPYLMNNPITIKRLLAGDYNGKRMIAGKMRRSIYQEYADCVVQGIRDGYCRK
jgi:N-acetylmuramoyl-L-alanine amidase